MTSFWHGGFTQLDGFARERSRNIKWETLWFACRATFECFCFTCRGEVRQCVAITNHTESDGKTHTCALDILWSQHADSSESSENRKMFAYFQLILLQTINRVWSIADYTASFSSIQGEWGAGMCEYWGSGFGCFPSSAERRQAKGGWRFPVVFAREAVFPWQLLRCGGPRGAIRTTLETPNYVYDIVIRCKCRGK